MQNWGMGRDEGWEMGGKIYFFFSIFICFIFSPMAVRVMYWPRTCVRVVSNIPLQHLRNEI